MRHVPEVAHLQDLAPHRVEGRAEAQERPGEAAEGDAAPHRLRETGAQFLPGQREAREGHVGEGRQVLADLGEPHRGAGGVGQPGPGMHRVPPPRIGQPPRGERFREHRVEPVAAGLRLEEIAGAQHDGADAAGRGIAEGRLHLGAQPPLARVRAVRRVGTQHRRHRPAEDIDIAGDQHGRTARFRRGQNRAGHGGQFLRPVRIGHVRGMHDQVAPLGQARERLGVAQVAPVLGGAGDAGRGAAGQHMHLPAGIAEGMRRGAAEAAPRPQDQDGSGHGGFLWNGCGCRPIYPFGSGWKLSKSGDMTFIHE